MSKLTFINATTGEQIASFSSAREVEAFDDQNDNWRKVRDIAEVKPDLRDEFLQGRADQRWLVEAY
jgi:hypothetical protein